MANQTVSTSYNFDDAAIAGLANGDDFAINTGAVLTLNSDNRWSQNAAVIGNITIASATGGEFNVDGSGVWWIPFDGGGGGNVPALGTVDTDDVTGSVAGTGEFLGIFTGYGVAPSSGAMPATGFLKLRRKTNDFVDNEVISFTGTAATVTVNSATGGKRGWLSVVGEEATTINVPRLGTLNMTGDWFYLDDTVSGARNQTIQLPVADQYGGVWIETGNATDTYEFWPNVGAQMTTTNYPATTTDARSKVVHISATGLLRIGSTTTPADAGFLPTTGARIRIPNIIISASTSANWNANLVSATLASRWDITTTSAGAIIISFVTGAGFGMNTSATVFGQMYSLEISHTVILEQFAVQECATAVVLEDFHVGLPATNIVTVGTPFTITTCFAGGTITDCTFVRPTIGATSATIGVFTDLDGFTFARVTCRGASPKTSNTPIAYSVTRVANSTFNSCVAGDGRFLLTTCQNTSIEETSYFDRTGVATTTAQPVSAIDLTTGCTDITINNFSNFGGLANVHPYTAIVNISANCQRIKVRNIATPASPYNMGSSNACGVICQMNGLNSNIKIQRVYVQNARTSAFGTMINSDNIITAECVWVDGGDTQALTAWNMVAKGCKWTNSTTGQAAVYGTHFSDIWTSTTAGRIVLHMNESTAIEPSATSYAINSGTPKFTSTGTLAMLEAGDTIRYTMPYYAQGITSFLPATATQPTFTGTNPNNHDIFYSLDLNDGVGMGLDHNLSYKRTGGGGSGGTTTITMTDTTGVEVDDYVFGTGVGTNAKVVSIDSGTDITVDVNNSGAVSGVLVFNHLPSETGIVATDGIKLDILIQANTSSATNAIQYLRIDTVTTSSDQNAVSYPLDPVDVTYSFSGLATGTEVVLFDSTNAELKREVISGTTFSYPYTWTGTDSTDNYALIWKNDKYPIKFTGITLGNTSVDVPISQADDLVYGTPSTNATITFASELIIMDTGAVEYDVQGIYSLWKDQILLTSNAQYQFAFSIVGGNSTGGANSIPYYTFLTNGWKGRPDEADHTLEVTNGVLLVSGGGDPFVDTLGAYTVRINYQQPVQAIAVSTGGGGGATAADVWSYATRRLSTTGISDITTGLATETNATTNKDSIITILNALNDIAPSDVLTQATSALTTYDPPTKAELDSAVAGLNDISTADVWNHAITGKTAGNRLKASEDNSELASVK